MAINKAKVVGSVIIGAGVGYGIGVTIKKKEEIKTIVGGETKPLEKAKALGKVYVGPVTTIAVGTAVIVADGVRRRRKDENYQKKISGGGIVTDAVTNIATDAVISTISDKAKDTKKKESSKEPDGKHPIIPVNEEAYVAVFDEDTCYDRGTGRYFQSNKNDILAIMNEINNNINMGDSISLNDFYYELGLEPIYIGEALGFDMNTKLNIKFDSRLGIKGKPVLTIAYDVGVISGTNTLKE